MFPRAPTVEQSGLILARAVDKETKLVQIDTAVRTSPLMFKASAIKLNINPTASNSGGLADLNNSHYVTLNQNFS